MTTEMEWGFLEVEEPPEGLGGARRGEEGEAERPEPATDGCQVPDGTDPEPKPGELGAPRRCPPRAWRESISDVREPLVGVVDSEREIRVVAELPGARAQDVAVSIEGGVLVISARAGVRRYRKRLEMPSPVNVARALSSLNNGVLELRLPKARRAPA